MKRYLVLGLGKSGLSATHFLRRHHAAVKVADTRAKLPEIELLTEQYPDLDIFLGDLPDTLLDDVDFLVISPGLSLTHPLVTVAKRKGVLVIGDVELFCQHAVAPIIAITGTNAKSTVVTLITDMIRDAGYKVLLGGNIGIPALDLLDNPEGEPDFYVLELSSFQLDTTYSLTAKVASILNITPDHMDRYDSFEAYIKAKQHIYDRCEWALYNRDDLSTLPLSTQADISHSKIMSFGLDLEKNSTALSMNLLNQQGICLARGAEAILPVSELKLSGVHNQSNCLAALAVSEALGIDRHSAIQTLRNFHGLPHRCEWVADIDGVRWINDSKGTNVGATLAALKGFCGEYSGKIVLLLGGVGKGADFSALRDQIAQHVKAVIVYGADAQQILSDLQGVTCAVSLADDFDQVIKMAYAEANKAGLVLFSPACASFDMFKNFEKRGEEFKKHVHVLKQERFQGGFNA